jgi:hypothetical protein
VEIERIEFHGQAGLKEAGACHPSYKGGISRRVTIHLGKNARPISEITKTKRIGGMS